MRRQQQADCRYRLRAQSEAHSSLVADHQLQPGLYEALLTGALDKRLADLVVAAVTPELRALADAEAADRLSRHLAMVVTRAIEALPEHGRAQAGAQIISRLIDLLSQVSDAIDREVDLPLDPARVLSAILRRKPDGSPEALDAPLTPLLDTTLLTNSRGEPAIGHEIRAEIHSSDAIDVVMAFVRWSGIRPLLEALRRHCRDGKPLRVVTTTYTNSTELRALDELAALGAEIKVSYDTASTRLHAKAWLFHRKSGYSTAYIGSSNLTHSAMVTGLEWNVRVSGVRNPDVVAKMTAVFDSYWASGDFVRSIATSSAPHRADRAGTDASAESDRDRAACRFRNDCSSRSNSHAPADAIAISSSRQPAPARRSWRRSTTRACANGCRVTGCSSSRTARRSSSRAARHSRTRFATRASESSGSAESDPLGLNTSSRRSKASTDPDWNRSTRRISTS